MTTQTSLWGTFSVADHRRKRPFVADVLLYDRLVIPVPDGDDETARWREQHHDPDLQQRLLAILGDRALQLPWSSTLHDRWAQRSKEATLSAAGVEASIRDDIAQAVEFDLKKVEGARRSAPARDRRAGGADPDDPGFLMTRMVLADEIGSRKDAALVARIPRVDEVETVVAYGSYRNFKSDRGVLADEEVPGSQPVFTFGWSFFVPSSSERTNDDLLREAVELSHSDEIYAWRAAVQRWRRDSVLKGESDSEALADMEALIAEYKEAARKKKFRVRSRWAIAVSAALAGSAAAFIPLLGVPAGLLGLGGLLPSHEIPKRLESAAMFHEARRRFS